MAEIVGGFLLILGVVAGAVLAQSQKLSAVEQFKLSIQQQLDLISKHVPLPIGLVEPSEKRHDREEASQKGKPDLDNPYQAALWLRKTLVDNSGSIPAYGFRLAYAQRKATLAYEALMHPAIGLRGMNPQTSGPSGTPWVNVGPSNVGGRTRSLVILPGGTTLIAGSVSGGIWRSTNGGTTWTPVNDQMAKLNIDCIEQDPNNANHLLAGTGEAFFNIDADSGDGIYQSTDGGQTWAQMSSTATIGNIAKIAFDPSNSNTLLAATVYNGIWRSTNGGNTWSNVFNAQGAMDVKFSPSDSTRAVADILNYNNGWYHEAYYSSDSGATWTPCAGIPQFTDFNARLSFGFSKSTANLCYCFSGNNNGQVWKSTDDGVTFAAVSATGISGGQDWYDNFMLVDPTNGNNSWISNNPSAQFPQASTNGGTSYANIASGYIMTTDPHPDGHYGVFDPGFNGTTDTKAYFTSDGGIFETDDVYTAAPGSGWNSLNNGYITSQFYSAEGDKSGIYLGGLQDNGVVLVKNGSTVGSLPFGGDGGFANIDHTNPNYFYSEYVYGQVETSHDGGQTGGNIDNGLTDAQNDNANFISPIMLDPNNDNTLLVGCANLWRTTNAMDPGYSPTWSIIRSAGSDLVSTIAIAQGDSTDIWIGQNDGVVSHTSNGTATTPTWTDLNVNTGGGNITRYVQNIAIDPNNHNRVLVAFGGLVTDNLYETTNGGSTWTDISGTGNTALPAAPVRYVSIHPNNSNWLFAGTAVGLYESMDGGTTWSATSDGPANVDVWDTRFIPGTSTILLGTHGRGLWTQNEVAVKDVQLSPNPVSGGTQVTGTADIYGQGDANGVTVMLSSSNTSVATVPASASISNGSSSVTFTINTIPAANNATAIITATVGSTSQSATLTVDASNAIALSNFYVSPTSVNGGFSTNGVVQLGTAAPTGGESVSLTSGRANVLVPSSVTIQAGKSGVSFAITTLAVSTVQTITITAEAGGATKQANVTLTPCPISNFYASPSSVAGGSSTKGVVQLLGKSGALGATISLSSSSTDVTVPATVKIPAGTIGVSFSITTSKPASSESVTLTATGDSSTKQTTVTLSPVALSRFFLSSSTLSGGLGTSGIVQLVSTAGPHGEVVSLQSGNTSVQVPATTTIPASIIGVSFAITTSAVASSTPVTLTATAGASSKQTTITLTPPALSDIYTSLATISGGTSTLGVVQLGAKAGTSGIVVSLSSSSSDAHVPATVTVPSGTAGVSFEITTSAVSASESVTLTATLGSSTKTTTLTLNPYPITKFYTSPTSVKGGTGSRGVVQISGPAGPSGDVVTLSSNNSKVSVPATVKIPAGATGVSFAITTEAVTSNTSVTLSATLGTSTGQASITLTP